MTAASSSFFGTIKNSFRRFVEAGQIGCGGQRFTAEGVQEDMAEPPRFHRRRHPRHMVTNPATMEFPAIVNMADDRVACRLTNISLGGAAVDVQLRSDVNGLVKLEIEGVSGHFEAAVAGTSLGGTHLTCRDDEELRRRIQAFVDTIGAAA